MSKKECPFKYKIPSYTEGDLSHEEMAHIKNHIENCEECRLYEEELNSLTDQLRELPQLTVSQEFTGKVMSRIKAEKIGEKHASPLTFIITVILSAVLYFLSTLSQSRAVNISFFGDLINSYVAFISDPAGAEAVMVILRGMAAVVSFTAPFIIVNLVIISLLAYVLKNRKIPVNIESVS